MYQFPDATQKKQELAGMSRKWQERGTPAFL